MKPGTHTMPTDPSWSTTHPLTSSDQVAVAGMRTFVESSKGKLRGVAARAPFDAIIGRTIAPEGVTFREDRVGGVPGWWCEQPDAISGATILHLHGGWFNWGSAAAYRNLVGHIARAARANAFVPDYRLAPEHPFPAAVDDARACFEGLIERGIRTIALTGDSAGGNLALSLLSLVAGQHGAGARPVAAAVLSPVTDLLLTGSSWRSRAEADPYFVKEQGEGLVRSYLNGHDAADAVASPLYGSLAGLPPIRIYTGDDEVLLDDSLRYAERAVAAGVDARAEVWEGMPHGFVGSVGSLEAADAVLRAIGAFLFSRLGPVS